MRHVFTDISQVAHLWANQQQDSAKNSGHNFYFSGKTIYSYGSHFPIAKHAANDKGEACVLFTERSYSNTTAKHIIATRQACRHLNLIYCYSPEASHAENFKYWLNNIETISRNLPRSRKPEIYLSQISQVADTVKKYTDFFDIAIPETLQVAMNIGNKDQYSEYWAKKVELEKLEAIRVQKELEKRHKKELKKWVAGETHRLYVHNGYDYLRLDKEDNRIQTTQAVQIPFEIGKRFWESLKSGSVQPGHKILDYTVDAINGTVKIGCHTFKTDYLIKFGEKIFN